MFCLHKISMAGKYHCPCAADVRWEGWHSPVVVSKAGEGKQKPSSVRPNWGLVLGTSVPSHYIQAVPSPSPYLATAGGLHFSTLALTNGCLVWISRSGRSRPSSLGFAQQLLGSKTTLQMNFLKPQ